MVVGVASLFVCKCSATLANMSKRSMHCHKVYKPSPNKQISPGLCPISFYKCNSSILFISRHVYYNTLIYTMKRLVATSNPTDLKMGQPQPTVWLISVAFGSVSVGFLVSATEPVNTNGNVAPASCMKNVWGEASPCTGPIVTVCTTWHSQLTCHVVVTMSC
jgi:hypothetical protein